MSELFLTLLNRSIAATWIICALVLLRPLLKRASKSLCAALWGLVGLRLVFPFSVKSALSLLPSAEPIPTDITTAAQPAIHSGIPLLNSAVNPALAQSLSPEAGASVNPMQIVVFCGTVIWLSLVVAMTFYAIFSTLRLRRGLSTAVRCGDHVYETEVAGAPFVFGLFRPGIYLPFHLSAQEREHMLAHERAHIRRADHWWKALGYALLTVFCFNPAVWLAYALLCRDIELACDAAVTRSLPAQERAAYMQTLLRASLPRRHRLICPLAFGEVGIRSRLREIAKNKKPALWLLLLALAASLALGLCLLTDPQTEEGYALPAEQWFDTAQGNAIAPIRLTQWPETTFYVNPEYGFPTDILAQKEDGTTQTLFSGGMPLNSGYFCDLNGDGYPELITSSAFGSGIIDIFVSICDYENHAYYEIRDRGIYDYYLFQEENGTLWVEKREYNKYNPDEYISRESITAAYERIIREGESLAITAEITDIDDECLYFTSDTPYSNKMFVRLDELPAGALPQIGQRVEFICKTNTIDFLEGLRCVSSIRYLDGAETEN